MMKNRIEDRGLGIEMGCGVSHAVDLTRSSLPAPRSSKGFSLISAIFLLVVIAALGTFAVTLSTIQHQSSALDVQGTRAYHAARAGIEWGAYQVLQGGGACAVSTPVTPTGTTLAGFAVTVTCASSGAIAEAGATVTIYLLTSKATQGAGTDYVERKMTVTIAQ